jgi:hypothetical protein
MSACIIVLPSFSGVIWTYINLTLDYSNVSLEMAFWITDWFGVAVNIVSCTVLGVSFMRLSNYANKNPKVMINRKVMAAHVLSYSIFILTLGILVVSMEIIEAQMYSYMVVTATTTSALSQFLLIFIFNDICN